MAQHRAIIDVLSASGVDVVQINPSPNLPYQFNVRDTAFVIDDELFLGKLTPTVRWGEPEALVSGLGVDTQYQKVDLRLEGGDIMLAPHRIFVGRSERTDPQASDFLATKLGKRRLVEIVTLEKHALHLDIALNLIAPGLGLIHRNSISGDLPQALREIEWIDINDSEFEQQATNVLVIKPGLVIIDERHRRILETLSRKGVAGIAVRMDEITKVGGGVRCMTLPLSRSDSDY